ncbi:MAG: hypothetical protein LC789_09515 [Actinobacteria bacterium]|nr:hypothetical protein [Actinomycetota bacterium]
MLTAAAVPSSAATPPPAGAYGGFTIDGLVPDAGATAYSDPHGSDSELGPMNGTSTKVGVIHQATPPMLGFTNPSPATDLAKVWMNVGKDTAIPDNTWLYLAWERDANSGSGQVMFEFDKKPRPAACDFTGVSPTAPPVTVGTQTLIDTCNPWANRTAGDFVIAWDWSGGSTFITKRTFVAGGGSALLLDAGVTLSSSEAKAAYSADLSRGEAAVNLSATVFPPVKTSCFTVANVIPGTVTGNSDTADYKDVVLNSFADQYISDCGSVKVTKVTNPAGQSGSFPVTLSRSPAGIINYVPATSATQTLTGDGDDKTFADLLPGTNYQLAESAVAGWELVSIVCGGVGVISGTFSVVAGIQTTCTVTNLKRAPALSLVKKASPPTYDSVGDTITYSYEVKNTGNVPLAGPVTVTDDKATVTCPALPAGGLVVGATTTCTASYTITQADLNAGSVTNKATASANGTHSNQDTATVTADQTKTLLLDKTASPATYNSVGDVISYAYEVTNTGNVTLAGPVTVSDNKVTVTCPALPAAGLLPAASTTCTASYTIKQADLDVGAITNVATASSVAGYVQQRRRRHQLLVSGDQHRQRDACRSRHRDRRQDDGHLPDSPGSRTGTRGVDHLHRLVHDHPDQPRLRLRHERGARVGERDRQQAGHRDRQRRAEQVASAGQVGIAGDLRRGERHGQLLVQGDEHRQCDARGSCHCHRRQGHGDLPRRKPRSVGLRDLHGHVQDPAGGPRCGLGDERGNGVRQRGHEQPGPGNGERRQEAGAGHRQVGDATDVQHSR